MSDNNNVENDNESDYVYLKRPYLFNIRYNSRQVWDKLPEEEKNPYANYEEYYEECRLIKLRSIGYPILAIVYLHIRIYRRLFIFFEPFIPYYMIFVITGFNIFSLIV